MLQVKQVIGGRRNVTLHITGMLNEGDLAPTPIDLDSGENKLEPGAKRRAKLANLVWVVQEKMVVYLYWEPNGIPLALESRNSVKLDPAMSAPDNWDGHMWIETRNCTDEKALFVVLDFDL